MRMVNEGVDAQLALALRTKSVEAVEWGEEHCQAAVDRIHYHGLAGLLAELKGWSAPVEAAIRAEALGRAMWELRHRQLLAPLLDQLADKGLRALLLKGTRLAYTLYDEPAHRTRGDSDLWVDEGSLTAVRKVLQETGFERDGPASQVDALQLEEGWTRFADDGTAHAGDLHWSAVNSVALRGLFDFDGCWSRRSSLPRLSRGAAGLGLEDSLLHAAVHRQMHVASPYMVDGVTHYGGDRLIWAKDIALLTGALGNAGIERAAATAIQSGLAEPLRQSLLLARTHLGVDIEHELAARLASAEPSRPGRYLHGGQVARAFRDLGQVPGVRGKAAATARRLFPSREFLGAKYGLAPQRGSALTLFLRRVVGFLVSRRGRAAR